MPPKSAYRNYYKCISNDAAMLAADSDFDQRYYHALTHLSSANWTELTNDFNI